MTPAVTPQPEKMSMDDFAGSIKAKYPGQYDHLDNQDLANRVLLKYPVYRQHVDIKPQPEGSAEHPGVVSRLAGDLGDMASSAFDPKNILLNAATLGLGSTAKAIAGIPAMVQHSKEQKKEGYSLPYRAISPVAEGLGVNVRGMEDSAKEGDQGGVMGHAAAVPAAMAITAGVAKGAPAISDVALGTSPKAIALGKVLGQEAISKVPVAGRIVHRPSIGDYVGALRTPKGIPVSEGLPEVEAAQAETAQHLKRVISDDAAQRAEAMQKVPRSEGTEEMEALRPDTEAKLRSVVGNQPAPAIELPKAKLGDLLNEATGGKPLAKGIPLRQQLDKVTPTAPKESSVVKSHSYDPNAKEMTVTTQNGQTYVHGDVTPDQAEAFSNADSKGKAWNELRNNSTLVGKVVNGKRVSIKPAQSVKTASPDDLTSVLEDSVKNAKSKKK